MLRTELSSDIYQVLEAGQRSDFSFIHQVRHDSTQIGQVLKAGPIHYLSQKIFSLNKYFQVQFVSDIIVSDERGVTK